MSPSAAGRSPAGTSSATLARSASSSRSTSSAGTLGLGVRNLELRPVADLGRVARRRTSALKAYGPPSRGDVAQVELRRAERLDARRRPPRPRTSPRDGRAAASSQHGVAPDTGDDDRERHLALPEAGDLRASRPDRTAACSIACSRRPPGPRRSRRTRSWGQLFDGGLHGPAIVPAVPRTAMESRTGGPPVALVKYA